MSTIWVSYLLPELLICNIIWHLIESNHSVNKCIYPNTKQIPTVINFLWTKCGGWRSRVLKKLSFSKNSERRLKKIDFMKLWRNELEYEREESEEWIWLQGEVAVPQRAARPAAILTSSRWTWLSLLLLRLSLHSSSFSPLARLTFFFVLRKLVCQQLINYSE